MKLNYTGPKPGRGAIPLPEGWPAATHDETDREVREAKLKSGMYERADRARKADEASETKE